MSGMIGFVVFFPMVSAIVGYLVGKKSKKGRDYFADAVTGVELAWGCILCWMISGCFMEALQPLCGLSVPCFQRSTLPIIAIETGITFSCF